MLAYCAASAGLGAARGPRAWVRPTAVALLSVGDSSLCADGLRALAPRSRPRGFGASPHAPRWYSVGIRGASGPGVGIRSPPHGRAPSPSAAAEGDASSGAASAGAGAGGGGSCEERPTSLLQRLHHMLSKEYITAPLDFNRWKAVPGSFAVQLSIGSVYAWSIFNSPLTKQMGVVAQAADDWALQSVLPIFSFCAVSLGLCTALLGPWAERAGPRKVAVTAATCWASGLIVTGVGCLTHTLPLCYLGYGVLGGAGWGLGYIAPVSTLLRWFPDRRGLATGLALTAFGGGAMMATPVNEALMHKFRSAPDFLGDVSSVELLTEHGKRFARVGQELKEVVVANAHDVASWPGLTEGVYVVGTGSTGVATTFLTLGAGYWVLMMTGAFFQWVPAEGWAPKGWTPPPPDDNALITSRNVDSSTALRTPQFYLLWTAVFGNAIAGVSVISCAKTLMNDTFSAALPAVVTGGFAASYVAALSAGNMFGRLGWASASDYLGRKRTYFMFGLGIPTMLAIPYITSSVHGGNTTPLILFSAGTVLVVSFYGGLFSVLPAYLADVFGQRHVGAIHGRALTAWSGSALVGPTLLSKLRSSSYHDAVMDLAAKADAAQFEEAFGAGLASLPELLDAKTVTISKLMDIMPPGTVDPTPTLYNTTMYTMAGIMSVALVSNALVRPVDPKYFMAEDGAGAAATPAGAAANIAPGAGAVQTGAAQRDSGAPHGDRDGEQQASVRKG